MDRRLDDVIVAKILDFLKEGIKGLTPDERHELMYEFFGDYCFFCGKEHPCFCMNDD